MSGKLTGTGIYSITHIESGRQYIGSVADRFSKRWARHRSDLRKNKHHNPYLQRVWNKYGEESFEFKIVEECSRDLLLEREQWYIDNWKPEFNLREIAHSNLGLKHSEETKRKMSLAQKGRPKSVETKRLLSLARTGLKIGPSSVETKQRQSRALMGHKLSPETKQKISAAMMGKQTRLGVKLSVETRQKISDANIGNTKFLGRKHSEAAKQKMREAALGRRK